MAYVKMEKPIILTDEEKEMIRTMFFGPYLDEWKVNGIVDNRDLTIAKRLGIHKSKICGYIDIILRKHIEKSISINELRNNLKNV